MVMALVLQAAVPGANRPVLASGLDLSPVVPHLTLSCFVNSQLVASCQLGFSIMFLLSLKFFRIIKGGWGRGG